MNATDRSFRLALTTAGSESQAEQLADALVRRRLAACVNILPAICSVYRWKGQVTRDGESLLLIKTTAARIPALREALRELHTYDVPELLVLEIDSGDPDYLDWLAASVEPGE